MRFAENLPTVMLIIRISQGVFALVTLALSGYVANWYNTTAPVPSPSSLNFLVFDSVWSFVSLACILFLPRFLPRVPKHYIATAFDASNTLFWFAGSIALGAFLNQLLFCHGDVCNAARAAVAFGVFSFCLWASSATLTVMDMLRTRRRASGTAGTGAVPMPTMKEGMA